MAYPAATTFRRPRTADSLVYLSDLESRDSIGLMMTEAEAIDADVVALIAAESGSDIASVIAAVTAENAARAFNKVPVVAAGGTSVALGAAATQTVVATITAKTMELGNASSGLGFAGLNIMTFPAGSIYRIESTLLELAVPGTLVGLDGDDNGDFSVGQVVTAAGVLTSTEATFVAKTAMAYDTAMSVRNDTAHDLDATSGAIQLWFNSTVDDGDVGDLSATTADWNLTGTITVTFTDLAGLV